MGIKSHSAASAAALALGLLFAPPVFIGSDAIIDTVASLVPAAIGNLGIYAVCLGVTAFLGYWLGNVATDPVVVGQQYLIDRLLVGLLANGHVLLEGVPGLAKTLAVRTLASAIHATFSRVQFTPDLLPADIIGTLIYNPGDGQ